MSQIIAFATREADLVDMTIEVIDGDIIARRRRSTDVVNAEYPAQYDDTWNHVRSGKRYRRLRTVLDLETRRFCYHYRSVSGTDSWLRPIAEWFELIDSRWRFEIDQFAHTKECPCLA